MINIHNENLMKMCYDVGLYVSCHVDMHASILPLFVYTWKKVSQHPKLSGLKSKFQNMLKICLWCPQSWPFCYTLYWDTVCTCYRIRVVTRAIRVPRTEQKTCFEPPSLLLENWEDLVNSLMLWEYRVSPTVRWQVIGMWNAGMSLRALARNVVYDWW